jgi:uncharacterized membrane protein
MNSHGQVQNRIDAIVIISGGNSPSDTENLNSPKYMVSKLIGCTLSLLQQLSDIIIVIFYSSTILASLLMRATLINSVVSVVSCISLFPYIILFKKFGRKSLLWVFSFAISASLIGLGVCLIVSAQWKEKYHEDNAISLESLGRIPDALHHIL